MILGMKGFLPKLFNLCVVDLRESFCSARLVVEPLSSCGGSCLRAMVCFTTIKRGGVLVASRWASLRGSGYRGPGWSGPDTPFECAPRRPAFSSGSCFLGTRGVFDGFIWLDDAPTTVIQENMSAPQVSRSC